MQLRDETAMTMRICEGK